MKINNYIILSLVVIIFLILLNILTIKPQKNIVNINKEIKKDIIIDSIPEKEISNEETKEENKANNNDLVETKPIEKKEENNNNIIIEPPLTPGQKNEEIILSTKTPEQVNDEYRKNLENKYGVTIKYGNEMGDYRLRGYLPTKLTDPSEIETNLNKIKTHIAYYPIGFFKEMKDYGMPLTIYLVKNIPGSGIAGIADKEFYSDIKITVCTDEFFFRVFHHEVYHYIEAYMEIVGYSNGIFNNWNDLNPEGFNYGTANNAYSYSLLDNTKSAYFINDYGQTNDREDRATIFEDLMARAYEPTNSYVHTNKIWDKGKKISEEIDRYFLTVNSYTTERWERFINN